MLMWELQLLLTLSLHFFKLLETDPQWTHGLQHLLSLGLCLGKAFLKWAYEMQGAQWEGEEERRTEREPQDHCPTLAFTKTFFTVWWPHSGPGVPSFLSSSWSQGGILCLTRGWKTACLSASVPFSRDQPCTHFFSGVLPPSWGSTED